MELVSLFLRPFGTVRMMPLFDPKGRSSKAAVSLHADLNTSAARGFKIVDEIGKADFVVIPHTMRRLSPEFKTHIDETVFFASKHDKKVIIFISGDLSDRVHVPQAIVLKPSIYRHERVTGEVAVATLTKDLSQEVPIKVRHKNERPVVSFCGYAGFPSVTTYIKYLVKNISLDTASAILQKPHLRAHKRGIYFRRKALALLQHDPRVDSRFIVRTAFFHQAGGDPTRMRREYLGNMQESDFVLCPKGDGNYSMRFYEALSLGRIPILIDTDMILPFEREINYAEFTVRVPHTALRDLPDMLAEFYSALTDEEFVRMQKRAREVYEYYLRFDTFFPRAFSLLKKKGSEAL